MAVTNILQFFVEYSDWTEWIKVELLILRYFVFVDNRLAV